MLILIIAAVSVLPFCASKCASEFNDCPKFSPKESFVLSKVFHKNWFVVYVDRKNELGIYRGKYCISDTIHPRNGSTTEIHLVSVSGKRGAEKKTAHSYGKYVAQPTESSIILFHHNASYGNEDYRIYETDYKSFLIVISCAIDKDGKPLNTIVFYQIDPSIDESKKIEKLQKKLKEEVGIEFEFVKQSRDDCDPHIG